MTSTAIRITDLAEPVLDDHQRAALAFGETLQVELVPADILAQACAATGLNEYGPTDFRERLDLLAR